MSAKIEYFQSSINVQSINAQGPNSNGQYNVRLLVLCELETLFTDIFDQTRRTI